MGTCPAVFAWDWAAKILMSDDETAVWLYSLGIVVCCLAATGTLCCTAGTFSVAVRCCSRKGETDMVVLKHGQKLTAHSCMTILLHNCSLLTGLAINYAMAVSVENSRHLDPTWSRISVKWIVTAFTIVTTLFCTPVFGHSEEEWLGAGTYVDHALIYTAAISLFESVYYSALKSAPTNSNEQFETLGMVIVIMFFAGSLVLFLIQRSLEFAVGSKRQDSHKSEFIEQTVEFLIVGFSYVLGKLCLFTLTHWLQFRSDTGRGHGLKVCVLCLPVLLCNT
jgi:hypothetical protein